MYQLSTDIDANIQYFNNALNTDKSFDMVVKILKIGGRKAAVYSIDGCCMGMLIEQIVSKLLALQPKDMPDSMQQFSEERVSYTQTSVITSEEKIITTILMGIICIFIDGYSECMSMDCREFPGRSIEEPEKDRVLRGSHDGFSENIVKNTALLRRRLRDPMLIIEKQQAGSRTRTDIALCYIEDRVDKEMLANLQKRIETLKVDALSMNQESLAECLFPHKWYNPFPKYKFSERPDATAAHILEGNIAVMVDNSPAAMIIPTSIFDIVEQADDYYFPPITGSYLRLTRLIISILTIYLTPVFLLITMTPEWLPSNLQFINLKESVNIPVYLQLMILEFSIDGLKLAAQNTPNMLSTPLSIIAGFVLGEAAIKSGWFNAETMLYMAFVAVANYTQTSFELGYALKFLRLVILTLTALFHFWGFAAGVVFSICVMVFNKTIGGRSYLYPLIPFSWKALKKRLTRTRLTCSYTHEKTEKMKKHFS